MSDFPPPEDVKSVPMTKVMEYARQVDLIPKDYTAPVYKYRQLQTVNGGQLTLSATSTTLSQYSIPGDGVWNLSRGYIVADVAIAASAKTHIMHADCIPLDSITFKSDSGSIIANIQDAQIYTKVSQALSLSLSEYITRNPVWGATAIGTGYPTNPLQFFQPAPYMARADGKLATATNVPNNAYVVSTADANAGTVVIASSVASDTSGNDKNGALGPQRLVIGTADAAILAVRVRIPLSAFLGTILACDVSLHFGQNMQLVLYWKGANLWGFDAVNADNTGNVVLATVPTISNYYLYMAEDVNPITADKIREQVRSGDGLQILIPYTEGSPLTPGASGLQTKTLNLSPDMGLCLKRVISIPYNSTNNGSVTANTFNVAGAKWTQVQTKLDAKPIQDQLLSVTGGDVWNYLRDLLKNSPAGLSERSFLENSFWIDNFSDCDSSEQFKYNDMKESGLVVDRARTYSAQFNLAFACSIYQYHTWVRRLIIKSSGVAWGDNRIH